jgi:hypothetical protein
MHSDRPHPTALTLAEALVAPVASLVGRLSSGVGGWARKNPDAARNLAWLIQQAMSPVREGEVGLGATERVFRRVFPPNWFELSIGAQTIARTRMVETGVCLAWVPRADVVYAFIAAKGKAERDAVLVEHAAAILDDADRVLAEVTHPRLASLRDVASEGLRSYRVGVKRAAQALSAAAVSAVLADHLGETEFRRARQRLTAAEARDLRDLRRVSVELALAAAIAVTHVEPPPEGFNRHLSAHGVDPDQYTDAHALAGLMLLVGVLRELHEIYTVPDTEAPWGPSDVAGRPAQGSGAAWSPRERATPRA